MALFDSMLKPGWHNPDPDIRKAAIAELDDESILTEIIRTDPDEDIRAQALALISGSAILDELLAELDGPLLEQARVQRLRQILPDNDALPDIHDDELLLRIASLVDDEELRLQAVDLLSDTSVRYDVALEHLVAKVRLSAAKGIEDLEVLQRLMNATQGKDKAIYRHCKDKVNVHKEAMRQEAERQKNIELLIDKAIKLSSDVDSPEYAASLRLLQRNWTEVSDHASQLQRDNIQLYLKTCAARVADKAAAVAADEEREAAVARAGASFGEVLQELTILKEQVGSLTRERDLSQLDERLAGLEVRWQGATAYARSEKEQAEQYRRQMGEWRQVHSMAGTMLRKAPKLKKLGFDINRADKSDFVLLEQLQQRAVHLAAGISWSGISGVEEPDSLVKLADWQGQLRTRLESLSRDEEKNTARVAEAMNDLRGAIDDGHMKDASRSLNKVRRVLKTLPGSEQKRHEKELRSLVARLDEIKDWQGFAIEPKKVELCEAMEVLVDSKAGAEKLAGQIHELQEQWKQLGPLAPQRDQELWRRFSAAADKAFEPCKEAFARQARERKANLARRLEVVEGLRRYEKEVDWVRAESSDFDWKAVLRRLDDTRSSMRAIKPVGQKGATRSEGALKKVSDGIYEHIRSEYDRNIQQKEDLISRAQKLSEVENLDQAIDQAKRLQPLWKGVGVTPVKVDRAQWGKFRTACDAVFQRLNDQKQQHRAEIDAVVNQAEALVKRAENLVQASDDEERLHIERSLGEIQQAINELELPMGAQQRLGKRLSQVESKARKVASETRKRLKESRWDLLYQKVRACAQKDDDKDAATKLWEQAGDIPRGLDEGALLIYREQGAANDNSDAPRDICIAMEVLADIESPKSDKQARMAFQVQRLAEGMGKQRENPRTTLVRLVNEFIACRPSVEWADRFCGVARQVSL